MALTYIVTAELRDMVGLKSTDLTKDGRLQQCGYAAEGAVDRYCARGNPLGTRAFSATEAGVVRYFDDDLTQEGYIPIDDALLITRVERDDVEITSGYYKAWPYNPGAGPWTRLYLRSDVTLPTLLVTSGSWYNHPFDNVGLGKIEVTGTWGFCTDDNRPPEIKEATLRLAHFYYKHPNISMSDLVAAMRDMSRDEWRAVSAMLEPYRTYGRSLFA